MKEDNMKQGWEIKKLGEVGTFQRGGGFLKSDYVEDGFPCIHYGQIHTRFGVKTFNHLTCIPEGLALSKSKIAQSGDIIIAITSEDIEGSCKCTAWMGDYNVAVGGHAAIFRHTLNPAFVAYYFKGGYFQTAKKVFAHGSKVVEIKPNDIATIKIAYPPLPVQEQIVSELDLLSGIIEKKREQLKELDALAQSIFYDMFGDPITNEKGWEVKNVGEVCMLKSGDSSANNTPFGTLPYIKVGDMNMEENIPYITTSSTFVSKEENKKGIFPIGTTIFPKRGGAIFTNKKRLTKIEVCCDLNTMGVIPQKEVIPLYIYHYFVSLDFSELCNGATIPQINNIDIAPLKIYVPPLEYQHQFASKIEAIERQKELIKQSIIETETLFNARMQEHFG